jgi:hypothetical protein
LWARAGQDSIISQSFTIAAIDRADKKALEAFIRFPYTLYRSDRNWVAPLLLERREHLAQDNPYFQHAKVQLWVARCPKGNILGRISAQMDQLGPKMAGERVGSFGMFECINHRHVAYALLCTAQDWLREQGCTLVTGPFNLSINQESGLLVEGFDCPPYIMMGHALPYYPPLIEYAGFTKARDLYAWHIRSDFKHTPAITALQNKYCSRIRVRPINKKELERDLELFLDIFNDAWSENWGFIPFTRAEFHKLSEEILKIVPVDLFRIAELDGEAVGMIVMLPNFNEWIADLGGRLWPVGIFKLIWRLRFATPKTGRVALMGVKRSIQNSLAGSAVAFLLIVSLQQVVVPRGIQNVEMSWVLEDNHRLNKMLGSIGGYRYKTYRIYQKRLTAS